ncbi:MAG: hypothetical protein PVJ51_05205 [Acidobacteriota bacterium]|jgi:hypothetical protein
MIQSTLERQPFVYIHHKVSAGVSAGEIALALEHAIQHENIRILWDLREMDEQDLGVYASHLPSLIDERGSHMSSKRRAFLVSEAQARNGNIEAFFGGVRWPWAVFRDKASALEWLGQDGD